MRRLTSMVCVGVVAMTVVVPRAQVPEDAAARADTPTFRVGTRLATIDAVVVDDKGRHVTDLKPEDFEIVERGKSQAVRQVVYVQVIGPDGRPVFQPTVSGAPAPAASPASPDAAARSRPLAGGNGLASGERAAGCWPSSSTISASRTRAPPTCG